jgi:hypothetical protein
VVHEIPAEWLPVRCETKRPAGADGPGRPLRFALRDSLPVDMLLSAVSVLVVAQSSSEVPEGLMNNPVFRWKVFTIIHYYGKFCLPNNDTLNSRMYLIITCYKAYDTAVI